ncbi:MAG TPA: adenine deaminase [Chloroflexia bacterium]|nr:adenine deaminase [Chloroflexia bacterium]
MEQEAAQAARVARLARRIRVARGDEPADLVLAGGQVVNVLSAEIYPADVAIVDGMIAGVGAPGAYQGREHHDLDGQLVCPALIDGHVHLESSMMLPRDFARAVVPHGTLLVVSDPHEIANVCGLDGIRFMLAASAGLPLDVFVMLSSCVPATDMETSGARLRAANLATLAWEDRVLGIAEVMNYPGVIGAADDLLRKIDLGLAAGRLVDGHAPGVRGMALTAYAASGISSDHESFALEEAREKLRLGFHVLVREGSTTRNLAALLPLITPRTAAHCSFCTDDKHPDDIAREGHIDWIVRQAIAGGLDPVLAVQCASYNTARHFGFRDRGALAPAYRADLLVADRFPDFNVRRVYRAGELVAADGHLLQDPPATAVPAALTQTMRLHPDCTRPDATNLQVAAATGQRVHVIVMVPHQIITGRTIATLPVVDGQLTADPGQDVLKLAVWERHTASGKVGVGFVHGFGLQRGALGSSVAHDSHNIVVVGTNDADMLRVAHLVGAMGGGQAAVAEGQVLVQVPLEVAGLMSARPYEEMAALAHAEVAAAQALGCTLPNPFIALAFVALPVIPSLKLTDFGLVDVERFTLIPLIAE